MGVKRRAGLSAKTIQNHVTFLHGLIKWSVKRGWAGTNPVAAVDRPPVEATHPHSAWKRRAGYGLAGRLLGVSQGARPA